MKNYMTKIVSLILTISMVLGSVVSAYGIESLEKDWDTEITNALESNLEKEEKTENVKTDDEKENGENSILIETLQNRGVLKRSGSSAIWESLTLGDEKELEYEEDIIEAWGIYELPLYIVNVPEGTTKVYL